MNNDVNNNVKDEMNVFCTRISRTVRLAVVPIALVILAGCATASPQSRTVLDIDQARAGGCAFLGEVQESKTVGLLFSAAGPGQARIKVRNTAATLGATHILWNAVQSGTLTHNASGKAYRCS